MIIGICGQMGAGKDTIARELYEHFTLHTTYIPRICSFATKLKIVAEELFNVDSVRKNERDRSILQQLGQKMREIDANVWINYLLDSLEMRHVNIITDVRYSNEAQAILEKGGKVFFISVPENVRKGRIEKRDNRIIDNWEESQSHSSEREPIQVALMSGVKIIDGDRPTEEILDDMLLFL